MNKLKGILLITLLFCIFNCNSAMASDWKIEVNGEPIDAEVKIIDGRSLIPLRTVGEALGLDVEWMNETQFILLDGSTLLSHEKRSDIVGLECKTNIYNAAIDGLEDATPLYDGRYRINTLGLHEQGIYFKMNVPPVNIEGRVYVPVRLICDSFGAPVSVKNNVISIGSCFTAEDTSRDKILQQLSMFDKTKTPDIIYADFIQQRLDAVGYIKSSTVEILGKNFHFKDEGVFYAKCLDFDNDGTDELFLIESKKDDKWSDNARTYYKPCYYVYTCKNGAIKLLASGDIFFSDSASELGFSTDANNKNYFFIEAFEHTSFYSLVNGAWTETTLETSSIPDWSISGTINGHHVYEHSNTATITGGYINSKRVTYKELCDYKDFLTSKGFDSYGAVTNRLPDWTPQNLIKKLKNA